MQFKPTRQQIEVGLDTLITDIFVEPSSKNLVKMHKALDMLEEAGYNLREYREMYQELKEDYDSK